MTDFIYLKKQVSIIINLYNSKRYEELIKKGMVLIKKFPNQIIFYNATALSFAALGKNKDAKSVLKDALIQSPNDINVLNNLGLIHFNIRVSQQSHCFPASYLDTIFEQYWMSF